MTTPNSPFDQLRAFLKDMFQFEEHDLDFGIYRITRMKRQFIQAFIDGEGDSSLRTTVTHALGSLQNSQSTTARHWLAAFAAQFGDMGRPLWQAIEADPADETAQARFKSLFAMPVLSDEQREQAEAQLRTFLETRQLSAEQLETRVYNHLLNFFELYYQNGDFGYNTRATSAFKVPYEADYDGSDTLFHWKHKDSYYIKTGNGFHSVRCQIDNKWLEFRLTFGGDETAESLARNNNKESARKHYRLLDIQPVEEQEADGTLRKVWQVRFVLAESSTPKVELYRAIWQQVFADDDTDLTPYLHKKPGKGEEESGAPLFNDLKDDFDKADGGQVKGIGQLRLAFDKYIDELAKRSEFADLGSNADERAEELKSDWVAIALWQLDRNLNKFYVGNDSDYFIHKDLQGFLTREKSRFIKQVIFSDLDALLHAGEDNATVLVARAFNQVADTLIGFLAAIENFQKGLFELKKKVVDTHYLISVGKIPTHFHARVFANEHQRSEWRDTFKVEVTDATELAAHPTLVVDTSLYRDSDPEFQDDLLGLPEFDNLDEQIDGLLINSENWQALNLLQEKFREQIRCIYIDPPYNTGDDGFLYKDSFRHSSWAAMIHDRLNMAREVLNETGSAYISIDDRELNRALEVSGEVFGPSNHIANLVWEKVHTRKNSAKRYSLQHEYIICFARSKDSWGRTLLPRENTDAYSNDDQDPDGPWKPDPITANKPYDADYKITKPNGVVLSRPHDRYWAYSEESWNEFVRKGHVIWGENESYPMVKRHLKNVQDGLVPVTLFSMDDYADVSVLHRGEFGDTASSKGELSSIFSNKKAFDYPKPVKLIQGVLAAICGRGGDFVLDFFAGSGTTAHAVVKANVERTEIARNKFICVEMGDYFLGVLRERIKRIQFSLDWQEGIPISSRGYISILKVNQIEQYEDLLDNLQPVWDETELPKQIPVKYLFRPEQNQLTSSLDLSRPFAQTLRIGKDRQEKTIDLMETWCYLQGYWVRSRRIYREFDRPYLAVETTHGTLVVFRDIDPAEDDTANLNTILARYVDEQGVSRIQRLELNFDADLRRLALDTRLIQAGDFLRGVQWQ